MNEYIDRLVKLYAVHGVDAIRADPSLIQAVFGQSISELSADFAFPTAKKFVEELKQRIESAQDRVLTADVKAQIGACLRLLLDVALFERDPRPTCELKLHTLRDLFMAMFSQQWKTVQVAHFNFVLEMLKEWESFFLSYTNRAPRITNEIYKDVIEMYVEPELLKRRNRDHDNILADAVIARLRSENLVNGFYDKQNIEVGDNLDDEIGPAAGGSFAFIQLVQRETFHADDPNWPFEEFNIFLSFGEKKLESHEEYRKVFRKRFAALLTKDEPDKLQPSIMPLRYASWNARVFDEHHFEVLPIDPIEFDDAIHDLAMKVVNLKHQIIDCVPD